MEPSGWSEMSAGRFQPGKSDQHTNRFEYNADWTDERLDVVPLRVAGFCKGLAFTA
jgi:hypothetical protein